MSKAGDTSYQRLVEGYQEFREEYLGKQFEAYRRWAANTQYPKAMMIACSDSRVNPAILTHAGLGDIFMVNNVANLVPPYREGGKSHHSTSAAIEYAVNHLAIEHIIVMGHSGCGGIRALMQGETEDSREDYSFIRPWMEIVVEAKDRVQKELWHLSLEQQACACERESLLVSLNNLLTFPRVKREVLAKNLELHAWHFDIGAGEVSAYSYEKECFEPLVKD